jgi:hypothetical protein
VKVLHVLLSISDQMLLEQVGEHLAGPFHRVDGVLNDRDPWLSIIPHMLELVIEGSSSELHLPLLILPSLLFLHVTSNLVSIESFLLSSL